jgi:peptidoglycan/xylan/chitin deacetylase (PgdA/CDA1 family)
MVKNFLFHRVNPERHPLWDPMDVALFDKCIGFIAKKYDIILIEDLIEGEFKKEKGNFATVIFDDGYKDNIQYAAPILDKYKCKASFYVVTDCIDKNIPPWTQVLEHQFYFTNKNSINLKFDFLPAEYRINKLSSKSERVQYVKKIKPFLKKISHEQRTLILNRVAEEYNDTQPPSEMMNWNDLRELKNQGHNIGSHTKTHSMLGTMTNEADIMDELLTSRKRIEQQLGHLPKTISYPVGSYNETTIRLSQEAGYGIGLAVKQTSYNPEKDNVFEIPRIELYNEPWWKTRSRITNLLKDFKKIIGRK